MYAFVVAVVQEWMKATKSNPEKNSKMLIISLVCLTNTFSVGGSTDLNFTNNGIRAISGAKSNAIAPNYPCRSLDLYSVKWSVVELIWCNLGLYLLSVLMGSSLESTCWLDL